MFVIVKSNIIILLIPCSRRHTLQIGNEDMTRTTAIGHLSEFQSQREKMSDYLERISLYFEVNGVAEDKQAAVPLTAIAGETYTLLTSLLSPEKPCDKSYEEITAVSKAYFEPKPIIIAKRFHFHR